MSAAKVRALQREDAPQLAEIFFEAVQVGTKDHYDEEQRRAWGGDRPEPEVWARKLEGMTGFVAELEGNAVGFMTIDETGYLDLAFVHPGNAGQGIGRLLYDAVEAKALELGARHLTVQASKAAKAFFEHQGWRVIEEQSVVRHGVTLNNYRMEKHL